MRKNHSNRTGTKIGSCQIYGDIYADGWTCAVATQFPMRESMHTFFLCSCKVLLCDNQPMSTHILFLLFSNAWQT
jgi:hypothetical protein